MIFLKLLMPCSIFIIFYIMFKGDKYDEMNSRILGMVGDKVSDYHKEQLKMNKSYIKKRKGKIISKVEELIKSARINEVIPFLNGVTFIIATIVCAIVGYYIVASILVENVPMKIIGIVAGALVPYLILVKVSANIENHIDEDTEAFINAGQAYAKTKNNLIYILENSIEDMSGPVKIIINTLLAELKAGVSPSTAFENADNKVNNIRFKELLSKLLTARLEQGNYMEAFQESEKVYDKYFKDKQESITEMKKVRKETRILIFAIIAACAFCAQAFKGTTEAVLHTLPGNLIMAYFGAAFIAKAIFDVETQRFKR